MTKRSRPSLTARMVAKERARLSSSRPSRGDTEAEARLYTTLTAGMCRRRWWDLAGWRPAPASSTTRSSPPSIGACARRSSSAPATTGGRCASAAPAAGGFEEDRPISQADKRRRLETAGARVEEISFVAGDLLDPDLGQKLAGGGNDRAQPTVWLCEGVLGYLKAPQTEQLCRTARAISAPGSILALNALIDWRNTWHDRAGSRLADMLLGIVGEPRGDRMRPGQMEDILQRTGWSVVAGGERGPVRGTGP